MLPRVSIGDLTEGLATTCILNISAIERLWCSIASTGCNLVLLSRTQDPLDLWTEHPADEDLALERVDKHAADHGVWLKIRVLTLSMRCRVDGWSRGKSELAE